ncbi:hypothetical protein ACFL4G_13405, partial [Thermodesulfobacteriota bacterium]
NDCQAGVPPDCDDGVGCTVDACNEETDTCDHTANDGLCDDSLWCNGAETCDEVNDCQAGTAPDCTDEVSCTDDTCNEETDSCDHTANDGFCDDSLWCNGAEICDAVNDCQAGEAPDCADEVACTDDMCNEDTDSCDNTANDGLCDNGLFCDGAETCDELSDCQAGGDPCPGQMCDEGQDQCAECLGDVDCDDGLWCNGAETCVDGACQAGVPQDCDDGVGCTVDACNEDTDICDHTGDDGLCDNGLFCDGAETCDVVNDCQTGVPPDCDDGVGCTLDACNEDTDRCDHTGDDGLCDDGFWCNGAETCDVVNDCQTGVPPDCDDEVGCTVDACNEDTDTCDHTGDDGLCDDGFWCNGAETCDAVNDCQAGVPPDCDDGVGCTVDACNEETDTCDHTANDGLCDDSLWCNGAETCDAVNDCQAGTAPDCADAVACTDDRCNEETDSCDHTANDGFCDDSLWCNGAETCDVVNDCQAGVPPDCDDGVGCTVDVCNEATDTCDHTGDDGFCDDGAFCNGAEFCDPFLDCQAGSDPCPGQMCDDGQDQCAECLGDVDCDDGLFCNGTETCVAGACQAGTAPDCVDLVACTDDTCNEETDSCANAPNDGFCDNGLFCDGEETCDEALGCQAGTAPDCADAVSCTDDACNEDTDRCDHTGDDGLCDDGFWCNGAETCDEVNDCQAGVPPDCDDGVGCT